MLCGSPLDSPSDETRASAYMNESVHELTSRMVADFGSDQSDRPTYATDSLIYIFVDCATTRLCLGYAQLVPQRNNNVSQSTNLSQVHDTVLSRKLYSHYNLTLTHRPFNVQKRS